MNIIKKILLLFSVLSLYFLFPQSCYSATGTTVIPITDDTYISNGIHMTNTSLDRYLFAGYDQNSVRKTSRTLLKVNLDEFSIPLDDIYGASLKLFQNSHLGEEPFTMAIMTPVFDWEIDNVTWANQVQSTLYQSYPDMSPENGWKSFDITNLFRRWVRDEDSTKGLMLKMYPDTFPVSEFWSYNCVFAPNLPKCLYQEQPHVEITYFVNTPPVPGDTLIPKEKEIIKGSTVNFSIEGSRDPDNHKLQYSIEISRNNFKELIYSSDPQIENTFSVELELPGRYEWRIKVIDERGDFSYSMVQSFIIQPITVNQPKIKKEKNQQTSEESKDKDVKETMEKTLGTTSVQKSTNTTVVTNELCILNYFQEEKRFEIVSCKISIPQIEKIILFKSGSSEYLTEIKGKISPKIQLRIRYHRCKEKTFLDPRTYFKCVYEKYKEAEFESLVKNYILPKLNIKYYSINRNIDKTGNFNVSITTSSNPQNKKIQFKNRQTISDTVQSNRFVFVRDSDFSKPQTIPKISSVSRPLSYFFDKIIGVTQWYGKTKYMNPHTGIDFGAVKEKIYSPADGVVTFIGWDNYYGKCLSGGNTLKIKHKNNLYTVYYHLKSFAKTIKVGTAVKKEQFIGTTGNTGAFNCQPLSYHMHFETRKSPSYTTHTNPVPLVAANWEKIPTLGYQSYPGRLSGENPHPSY